MIKVGLTGGIGSGKSTIAKIFEVLGIPVYYADDAAKELMNTDTELKEALIKYFGEQTYQNSKLNRAYLAAVIFADKEKLNLLNSIIHPATIRNAARWIQEQTSPYIIKEAALLFESGANKYLDYIIGVNAPQELRIKRVMVRDNVTREEVLQRLNRQMDENAKMKLCNCIIQNDEQEMVIPQVMKLHEKFLIMQPK